MMLSKNSKRLLIILAVAIIFALSLMIASLVVKNKDPRPAPDITAVAADGSLRSLSDHLNREPVVLIFFDTETPIALDLLKQIEKSAPNHKAAIMAVACNGEMKSQQAKLSELKINQSNIIYDTEGSAAKTYNISATPVTYFIDKSGMVREVYLSSITEKTLEKAFSSLD